MIFERQEDLEKEKKAISLFVNTFGGSFKKLDPFDVDYKIFDKDGNLIAYAEVKGRIRTLRDAYPLPVAVRKLVKLNDKRITGVVIWACDDGIIYGRIDKIYGDIRWGGREPRPGAANDTELIAYYEKQKHLKYVRY